MRLGQLARKYDIPVQEIVNYLEEQTGEKFHPNVKIYDSLESKVIEHFNLHPTEIVDEEDETGSLSTEESTEVAEEAFEADPFSETESKEITEPKEEAKPFELPSTPEEDIAAVDGEINSMPEEEKEVTVEIHDKDEKPTPKEDEVIQTDKLLEMLESDEGSTDLDKIKLIKAPKKELSGLKVVGKVELPEPKKKEEKAKEVVTEKDLREYRYPQKKKRAPLTEEEKEKRRLKAKKKKEAYEARQEKRRKEQQEQKKKARKQEHYKQKLEQAKAVQVKRKAKQQTSDVPKVKENSRPQPKTALGKFWRWLNT